MLYKLSSTFFIRDLDENKKPVYPICVCHDCGVMITILNDRKSIQKDCKKLGK